MSDQPTPVAAVLPMADILPLVLQYLVGDLNSLCACALLDRNSNRAASAILYRDITFSPPWTATLDLNEAHKYSVRPHATPVRSKMDAHNHRTVIQIPAAGNDTSLRNAPSSCRLCKDGGNWGYGSFERREAQFESD
jgi:hypothetical protein